LSARKTPEVDDVEIDQAGLAVEPHELGGTEQRDPARYGADPYALFDDLLS
jgi:hypothetical protein